MKTLREWRNHRGYSIRQLAERAGLSPTIVHEAETGKRLPTLTSAGKLCNALSVSPGDVQEFAEALGIASTCIQNSNPHSNPGGLL